MLPQNGQHPQRGQQGFSGFSTQGGAGFDGGPYFNLDPGQAAKQMAALNAVGHARIATNSRAPSASLSSAGGTTPAPYFGGTNPPTNYPAQNHESTGSSPSAHANFQIPNNAAPPMPNPSLLEPSMSQNAANAHMQQQRQQQVLNGLHNLHIKRGSPLPPFLTGATVPNYDYSTSSWGAIEPGSEIGSFKLAGKDVNLFVLWSHVYKLGGGDRLNSLNGWNQLLRQFDLPEEFPPGHAHASSSVAAVLAQYYRAILTPFEESYKKNVQENQRKAGLVNRAGMMQNPAMGNMPPGQAMLQQSMNNNPAAMQRMGMNAPGQNMAGPQGMAPSANGAQRFPMNQALGQRPQSGMMVPPGGDAILPGTTPEVNLLDQDVQGIKRKLDSNELDNKRVRPRTDGQDGSPLSLGMLDRHSSEPQVPPAQLTQSAPSTAVRPRQQPSRRKIEYIPLAREVDTFGGRDFKLIETEYAGAALPQRRGLRDLNEWGTIDVEHLALSIRSRISTELSYGLTTFTLLSTMRGQQQGSGFPISQCPDLLDEALDLVEDLAFGGPEAPPDDHFQNDGQPFYTNKQLTDYILEEQQQPFAGLEIRQGSKDPDLGPVQRPANYILAVLNIVRNLSCFTDNIEPLGRNERLVDLLLRLCTVVTKNGVPTAASPALSLNDLISVRKDTLYTLSSIATSINLLTSSPLPSSTVRMARRAIDLISSYLIDPSEAVSPLACIQQAGVPIGPHLRPPHLADIALEVLTKFTLPDSNRQSLAKAIPQASLWTLFSALVHRMPVLDTDFQLMVQDQWLEYSTQLIMAVYSLVFLAPPELKQKMRSDRRLGFKSVMLRMLSRFLATPETRMRFMVCARRATETLKVLDDALDPFENPADSSTPALSFGMGFSDSNDNGQEKGTGLLGAHRDLGWEFLMAREVLQDDIMFRELESLVRVECQ